LFFPKLPDKFADRDRGGVILGSKSTWNHTI